MRIELPKTTLIIGGAASGKSVFAEKLITACGQPKTYIATAQAFDTEMTTKVKKHQAQRGEDWTTHEEPFAPWHTLADITSNTAVLLDCATLWLSNMLLENRDIDENKTAFLNGMSNCVGNLVVVTNEVGQGVVPDNKLARRFRQAQGELNQDMAKQADLVVFITAGLPMVLKGKLPVGLT